MVSSQKLLDIDPKYFAYRDIEECSDHEICYALATWNFDNEWNAPKNRQRVKEHLPLLYVQFLEYVIDGKHDT